MCYINLSVSIFDYTISYLTHLERSVQKTQIPAPMTYERFHGLCWSLKRMLAILQEAPIVRLSSIHIFCRLFFARGLSSFARSGYKHMQGSIAESIPTHVLWVAYWFLYARSTGESAVVRMLLSPYLASYSETLNGSVKKLTNSVKIAP